MVGYDGCMAMPHWPEAEEMSLASMMYPLEPQVGPQLFLTFQ